VVVSPLTEDGDRRHAQVRQAGKVMTLTIAMIACGTHIDHTEMLRVGSTAAVLGRRVMSISTIGALLRTFRFGSRPTTRSHQRIRRRTRLGRQVRVRPVRGWSTSTRRSAKSPATNHGAGYGCTHKLGYHPILATHADTG
jgi:hypothetical protein